MVWAPNHSLVVMGYNLSRVFTGYLPRSYVQDKAAEPRPYTFDDSRGHAICCLLAAHAMCQLPMDLDLTDGRQHHLLRLRDHMLLVYEACTPTQVIHPTVTFWTSFLLLVKIGYQV